MNWVWTHHLWPGAQSAPVRSSRTTECKRDRRARAGLAALGLAAALIPAPAATAPGQNIVTSPTLRIATWDVSQAEKSIFTIKKTKKKSSWRHTFGSERHDTQKSRLGIFNLDVDVVLLQGVRNVRALRRVFPTRHWKLILSKDYMRYAPPLSRLPSDLRSYDIAITGRTVDQPVTAIAVRYQRRLRVRGIRHIRLKDHVDPSHHGAPGADRDGEQLDKGDLGDDDLDTADLNTTDFDKAPSATAVRLNYFGSYVWLISAALLPNCQSPAQTCPTWQAIKTWYRHHAHADHQAALAGTAETSATAKSPDQKTPQRCGRLVPLTEICRGTTCPQKSNIATTRLEKPKRLIRKTLGCLVMAPMHLPPATPSARVP